MISVSLCLGDNLLHRVDDFGLDLGTEVLLQKHVDQQRTAQHGGKRSSELMDAIDANLDYQGQVLSDKRHLEKLWGKTAIRAVPESPQAFSGEYRFHRFVQRQKNQSGRREHSDPKRVVQGTDGEDEYLKLRYGGNP